MVLRVQVKFAHSLLKCGWLWVGHNLCLLWVTYVCFVPSRLPVFAVEPQYLLQDFLFLSKVSFEGHIQNLQKISCWFKFWMRFVGPILIKLWMSCIWGVPYCPACRTTLIATRFRVAVICPIIQVPHCIRIFFYFVWFVFINHIFQFYYELCTYCNILDIYLS